MFREPMSALGHSFASYLRDSVVRTLFGSSRLRELQVFRAAEARL